MRIRRSLDYAVYMTVRVLILVVQALPLDVCQRWAEFLAVLFCDILRIRRQVVDDNLRHAYPALNKSPPMSRTSSSRRRLR